MLGFQYKKSRKIQKRAVRIISKSKYNAHTDPLFKKLGILKAQDIFTLNCLKLYKFCSNALPSYFDHLIQPVPQQYTGWSKKSDLFCFGHQSSVLHFFSLCFRSCREKVREILLTPK